MTFDTQSNKKSLGSSQNLSSFGLPRSPSLTACRPIRAGVTVGAGGRRHARHVCTPRCSSRTYLLVFPSCLIPVAVQVGRFEDGKLVPWSDSEDGRRGECEKQTRLGPGFGRGRISSVARRISRSTASRSALEPRVNGSEIRVLSGSRNRSVSAGFRMGHGAAAAL